MVSGNNPGSLFPHTKLGRLPGWEPYSSRSPCPEPHWTRSCTVPAAYPTLGKANVAYACSTPLKYRKDSSR